MTSNCALYLCCAALCMACETNASPAVPSESVPIEAPTSPAEFQPAVAPPFPAVTPGTLLAPERMTHVIPRISSADALLFRNLAHETGTSLWRAGREEGLLLSGSAVNTAIRTTAARIRLLALPRDGLFFQQDHPVDHDPWSLSLPPSWVSVAVAKVTAGEPLVPMRAPAVDDDEGWESLRNPLEVFGSFPPVDSVFQIAVSPRGVIATERMRIANARRSLQMLAQTSSSMVASAPQGAEAVARAGAAAIAESDERYFGARLRREHILLWMMVRPSSAEAPDQIRSFTCTGTTRASVEIAQRHVLTARYDAGPIGLERFRLSEPRDREELLALLGILRGRPSSQEIWVGVVDPLNSSENSSAWASFRRELDARGLRRSNLHFVPRPAIPIGGREAAAALESAARSYRSAELAAPLNLDTAYVARIFQRSEP